MRRKRDGKIKGFLLSFISDNNERIFLKFVHDHHAEQVLRGLVHSGYEVTLSEQIMDMPDRYGEIAEHNDSDYGEMQPLTAGLALTSANEA